MMQVDGVISGAYETNCYIVRKSSSDKECLLVDAGLEASSLIVFLKEHHLNPVSVVLTHGHIDHIGGLPQLRSKYPDLKVYIHKLDAEMLGDESNNLSLVLGQPMTAENADFLVEQGSSIETAGMKLEVLHTPGHTPGGMCLYAKEDGIVFVGDTLFADSIGRTDFPNGSMTQLVDGIKKKLLTLPSETVCYPGHGPTTTIAREKAHNQYLQ